jgi:Family of unknown function (DUF6152)
MRQDRVNSQFGQTLDLGDSKMKWTAKSKVAVVFSMVVGLLLLPGLLLAHHNHQVMANYDKLLGVTGVVTEHEFINPHTVIHVTATDENGNKVEWAGYGSSPTIESRMGYSAHMFKIGEEKITMYGFPNKDGRNFMVFVKLVRANGEDIPIYQTEKNDLDAFMKIHNADTFKELSESVKRYVGGQPYQATDDK